MPSPISDAKVLTGRQKPLTEIAFVFAEIETKDGHSGVGFGYSKRAGGPGMYAHAKEIAPNLIGEDPSDIQKIFTKLLWAGASMGRSGMTTQAIAPFDIALWDLKAKRAGLPLAKLLGAHRDSVQCLQHLGRLPAHPARPGAEERGRRRARAASAASRSRWASPTLAIDLKRVAAVRKHLGDGFPLMVDANQQWDRASAMRACRRLEEFDLTWIEEPLDAYDDEGHAALAAAARHAHRHRRDAHQLQRAREDDHARTHATSCSPTVRASAASRRSCRSSASPSRRPSSSLPTSPWRSTCTSPRRTAIEPWLEHFEWLEPLFNERLEMKDGRMLVPDRPGAGFSLSEQARAWTKDSTEAR